jgi:hypothetical protein
LAIPPLPEIPAAASSREPGPPPARSAVRLEGVRKHYGDVEAVAGIDLDIRDGEFFSMLGPSGSIEEASMDLGADTLQTFRYVTFPVIRTALIAGGLLAFALSFDEVIVTTFTAGTQETIPIWIFEHIKRANQLPVVNVVAVFLILLSTIPVYLAQRLSSDTTGVAGR